MLKLHMLYRKKAEVVPVRDRDVCKDVKHLSNVNRAPSMGSLPKIPNEVGKRDVSLNSIPAKLMHRISSSELLHPLRNLLGTKKTAEPQMSGILETVDTYISIESNEVNIYEEVAPTIR